MIRRDKRANAVIGGLTILLLLALGGFRLISQKTGSIPFDFISIFFIVFGLMGLMIIVMYRSSSRLAEVDEYMDDPTTGPVDFEGTTPRDYEPRMPGLLCLDCGHKNPKDADFCIRCGQDLDVTDDVSRY